MFLTPEHLVEKMVLKKGSVVADFGSGSGAYTIALLETVGIEGKVYAIDIHRDALKTLETEASKQGFQNLEIMWVDLDEKTHLADLSLDGAVISNTLFLLDKPERAVEELARVLKPGATCLCVEWSKSGGGIGPKGSHLIKQDHAEALFQEKGFTIHSRLPAGDYHYAFLAIKL
jgi:ubiquinone/menaquinone biosynthesis C-methylase UbiE